MDKSTGAESPTRAPILAGRYELGPVLGRGGMATVRDATDRRLGRRVAVKILRADLAEQPRARARFEAEAHAAARLAHPNVVMVFDSGEEDGSPFLVMERLSGRTFADELAEGPVAVGRVCDIADEILAALTAAHEAGIIHRDIKPGNVLLTDDGHAKVSDFGIAKTLDDGDQTQTAEVLATPGYLAPERLAGQPASERSDLYSVGVLLYEAFGHRRPFSGDTPLALMRAIERGEAEPLTSLRPDLPAAIVAVVERAMRVDPAERFRTAAETAAALNPSTDLDATVAVGAVPALDAVGPAPSPTVLVDRGPRDGDTRALPVAALAETTVGRSENHQARRRVLSVVFVAAVAAGIVGIVASRHDSSRPIVPAPSTATTPPTTALTRSSVTTAPATTPTTARPAKPPPSGKDKRPGKGPKG